MRRGPETVFSRNLFWAFLALMVWMPIPLGSNRPLWIAFALVWALLLLVGCVLAWNRGHLSVSALKRSAWPVLFLGMFLIWQVFQLFFPLSWLVPEFTRYAYSEAGDITAALSIDPAASRAAIYESLLVILICPLVLLLVDSRYRVRQLLWVCVAITTVLAVLAGISAMDGSDALSNRITAARNGVATGSFINRNHFANYLMLALSAGIGLLISLQSRGGQSGWRSKLRYWVMALLGEKARLRVFLALMVIALVLTHSRMGNTAFFVGLLVAGVSTLLLMRGRKTSISVLVISLLVIDIFLVGTWFGVEKVVQRIQDTVVVSESNIPSTEQNRLDADKESLVLFKQVAATGTGGGSYYTAFPMTRSPDQKFFHHAHNDYLEFLVEYGVIGFVFLLLFVSYILFSALRSLKTRRDPLALGVSFAALMALVGMGLHATVDFSLQIPANAVLFMVLCSLPLSMEKSALIRFFPK